MKSSAVPFARALFALAVLALPAAAPAISTAPTPAADTVTKEQGDSIVKSLRPKQGKITLKDGIADLNVPADFQYLDPADTRKVLVDLWGNLPGVADGTLGMIVPADVDPREDRSWGTVISYSEDGYVSDEEAGKIDYAEILGKLKQSVLDHNEERVRAGHQPMTLLGWAQPPRYDKDAKKFYWAKELQIGDLKTHTLNYDIRILGRRGVLVLSTIAVMPQLDEINNATPQLLAMVDFTQGNRYAEFNPKTDKMAAYGLAGLIGVGVLAKAGAFKALLLALGAGWKFVVAGAVAVGTFFKRLFGGGTKANTDRPGPPMGSV